MMKTFTKFQQFPMLNSEDMDTQSVVWLAETTPCTAAEKRAKELEVDVEALHTLLKKRSEKHQG
jgi:hypothetical protein